MISPIFIMKRGGAVDKLAFYPQFVDKLYTKMDICLT